MIEKRHALFINGHSIAEQIHNETKLRVEPFRQKHGYAPGLAIVHIGNNDAASVYTTSILRLAEKLGFGGYLETPANNTITQDVVDVLQKLNQTKTIHGILLQLPLPDHIDLHTVISAIDPAKDIDGMSQMNAGNLLLGFSGIFSSTASAVVTILEYEQVALTGRHVVVVSSSALVGKPLSMLLLQRNATVTLCNVYTEDIGVFTRQADIVISAAGVAGLITGDMIKPDAVVIDVGVNVMPDGKVIGDVDNESVQHVARLLTPTPGGVGPVTSAILLQHCMDAALSQR